MTGFIYFFFFRPHLRYCITKSHNTKAYHEAYKFSWASLMAQKVKSLPTMQETKVQSLRLEDFLRCFESFFSLLSLITLQTPGKA